MSCLEASMSIEYGKHRACLALLEFFVECNLYKIKFRFIIFTLKIFANFYILLIENLIITYPIFLFIHNVWTTSNACSKVKTFSI